MGDNHKSNNYQTDINSDNSNARISNNIDTTNKNIQNINNIVGANLNRSNNGRQDSSQESINQNSSNSNSVSNISTENNVNNTNTNLQNINTIILSGIENAKALQNGLSQMDTSKDCPTDINNPSNISSQTISDSIDKTSTTLQNINNIKEQLAKLELDPWESVYFNYNINPLLIILKELSTTSYNLASSSNALSTSAIVSAKHSKIKDTIHLVYNINDQCEDVYKVLKRRIDFLLDHAKNSSCLNNL